MQSLENQIWRSHLAISTKLKLYNMCIVPIFLYGLDCWAISKMDACRIDALDQWCLHILLGIKWYQFVWNDDVRRLTKQPKLTAINQSRQLTLFGHIMRMDDNAYAERILLASPLANWRRYPGWVVPISCGLAPFNRISSQSSRFGSSASSVENVVYVWRYTILELHARNDDDDVVEGSGLYNYILVGHLC